MIGSLRIMHFGFLISVIVAVLIIGQSLDVSAQKPIVECPCDYGLDVPKTTGCWKEPFGNLNTGPDYAATVGEPPKEVCFVVNIHILGPEVLLALFVDSPVVGQGVCGTSAIGLGDGCTATTAEEVDLTPEEVKACQCALLEYTTALNMADNDVEVQGGPPYECFEVTLADCRPPVPTPIPTLNEYGMIITAGVLGLLAVIGLLVIKRRKVSA